jgi:hypothetical protein
VWTHEEAHKFVEGNPNHAEYGLLLDRICVIDAAAADAGFAFLEAMAEIVPEFAGKQRRREAIISSSGPSGQTLRTSGMALDNARATRQCSRAPFCHDIVFRMEKSEDTTTFGCCCMLSTGL